MGKVKSREKKRLNFVLDNEYDALFLAEPGSELRSKLLRKFGERHDKFEKGPDNTYKKPSKVMLKTQVQRVKMKKAENKLREGRQILTRNNSLVVADRILAPNITAHVAGYL